MSLNSTKISYFTKEVCGVKGFTWNPVTGCTMGCEYCWARDVARKRLYPALQTRLMNLEHARTNGLSLDGFPSASSMRKLQQAYFDFKPTLHPERLDAPAKRKTPAVIGVCFMGDLFDPALSDSAFYDVIGAIQRAPQHAYIFLTKRPDLMAVVFSDHLRGDIPPNWHLGFSATNQADFDERWPHMAKLAAAGWKVWLSLEPMVGPINFRWCIASREDYEEQMHIRGSVDHLNTLRRLSGVILGGQSGKDAKPLHPDWVRSVRDQCAAAGVPFHFKQWGEWVPTTRQPIPTIAPGELLESETMSSTRSSDIGKRSFWAGVDEFHNENKWFYAEHMERLGTKKAGATLDGAEHKELAWDL